MSIGILTFHCADNYGAMLQAYGLKYFVKKINENTQIIPYEPLFLRGQYWLFPIFPGKLLHIIVRIVKCGIYNLIMLDTDYLLQKKKMQEFRKKYLTGQLKSIRTVYGLQKLTFDTYILGSDQIWNPDITNGLRKAYFGAFANKYKKNVIAYAASLGGNSLQYCYDEKLCFLLSHINSISVREESAIPYLSGLTKKEICAVLDPVFLLSQTEWEKIEKVSEQTRYILVYVTERNEELIRVVEGLAAQKGLKVIELKYRKERKRSEKRDYIINISTGPAEFLGYIHHADYVLTNSFHAVAFSIIFQKKFLAFELNKRNARIENILNQCGLIDRMARGEIELSKIDEIIDWEKVKRRIQQAREKSICFLVNSLSESM